MSVIQKDQIYEKSEDFGGAVITQKCKYCSNSNALVLESDDQKICVSIDEFESLCGLINECMKLKGLKLNI